MHVVLRWFRVALLVWGALTLVGVAAMAFLILAVESEYDHPAPTAEELARMHVERLWNTDRLFVALVGQHETSAFAAAGGRLRVTAVRLGRDPLSDVGIVPRTFGDAARRGPSPLDAVAISHLASRLELPGPAWLPSASELRSNHMQVLVWDLSAGLGDVDATTLYALRPSDHMLFVFEDIDR
jgi:hypothetical protein